MEDQADSIDWGELACVLAGLILAVIMYLLSP